ASIAFTRAATPDLRLAAWLRWIAPLLTALSSLRSAIERAFTAASLSPASTALFTLRSTVLTSDLIAVLRSRRFSFVIARFFEDFRLANVCSYHSKNYGTVRGILAQATERCGGT